VQTRNTPLAQPFTVLLVAIALMDLGLMYAGFETWLIIQTQMLPHHILAGVSIVLFGYAVARYAAMLEGRPMDRDFVYALLLVGSLTAFYAPIVLAFYHSGQVSFVTLVVTLIGAVAANSLFDGARIALHGIFYQRQFRTLRGNLRALSREAGTSAPLSERLQAILDSLCRGFQIGKGFIALRNDGAWIIAATHDANPIGKTFEPSVLSTIGSVGLLLANRKGPPDMALLIPLYAERQQIGAIVLGAKESTASYSEAEIKSLEDLGSEIATLIHTIRMQEENARTIDARVRDFREKEQRLQLQVQEILTTWHAEEVKRVDAETSEENLLPQVEDALGRLYDFSYLGEHPLAKLRVVERHLQARQAPTITFIERGKSLSEVLVQALSQLRPDSTEPQKDEVPSREWHPFIILYDSYVADEANRAIMHRLYIGEGTFNRTRRRALRSLARSLAEIECKASEVA
jgi:hypothetical protein